jgi:hypothetical protein
VEGDGDSGGELPLDPSICEEINLAIKLETEREWSKEVKIILFPPGRKF